MGEKICKNPVGSKLLPTERFLDSEVTFFCSMSPSTHFLVAGTVGVAMKSRVEGVDVSGGQHVSSFHAYEWDLDSRF